MRVLLVDDNEQSSRLEEQLKDNGHTVTGHVSVGGQLLSAVNSQRPDAIVVDLEHPSSSGLEKIVAANRELAKPIVLFTNDGSSESIQRAVKAGISAYVVDGLDEQRLNPVLEVAVARFNKDRELASELERTKRSLNDRKIIERAKGILMQKCNMSEEDAYKAMRSMAMEQNQKMVVVARNLIAAARLLG